MLRVPREKRQFVRLPYYHAVLVEAIALHAPDRSLWGFLGFVALSHKP